MACVGYLYSNPLQTVLEGIETEVQSLQTVEVRSKSDSQLVDGYCSAP